MDGSTDAKNVVGYSVYNGSNIVATVGATSYTVTGLSSGTDYTFTVKSKMPQVIYQRQVTQ
jgi:chitodextrinase